MGHWYRYDKVRVDKQFGNHSKIWYQGFYGSFIFRSRYFYDRLIRSRFLFCLSRCWQGYSDFQIKWRRSLMEMGVIRRRYFLRRCWHWKSLKIDKRYYDYFVDEVRQFGILGREKIKRLDQETFWIYSIPYWIVGWKDHRKGDFWWWRWSW